MRKNGGRYKVVSRMTAYEDQAEGFTLTTHAVLPGEILTAEASSSSRWEGMEVVRAIRGGMMPLCVEIGEFQRCTEGRSTMNVIFISIDHYLQLVEAETDSESLRTSKTRLREILKEQLAGRRVAAIFEESSPRKDSIAAQIAGQRDPRVPWHNISMTEEERRAAGIYEALLNRPGGPDETMEFTIEERIPADEVREDYFTGRILDADKAEGNVIVLLGDMHVQPVADRLLTKGHTVEIFGELVPVKRWK
jgi:hypothetical protein